MAGGRELGATNFTKLRNFMKSKIESLLFVAGKSLSVKKLAEILDSKKENVEKCLEELKEEYKSRDGGIILLKNGDEYQFATSPKNSELVSQYLKEETEGELTRPQLETLSVIAYRGPITKPELEQIRGVNCSLILRNLLIRGLIEEEEDAKSTEPRYKISFEFLRHLGVSNVEELPDYKKLSGSEILQNILQDQKLKTQD